MRLPRQKSVGINGILQLCNGVVFCLILFGFFRGEVGDHPYIDWLTLVLGLALCLQTQLVLLLERRNPDPFVLIMAYLLTFFYALRIFTLLFYPVQDVFERYSYGPSDSNHALLYMLIANIFLYAGFYQVKLRGSAEIETASYQPRRPRIGVALFVISLLFGLLLQKQLPESIAPFINLIYNNFLVPNVVLMVLAVYVLVFLNRLPSVYLKIVLSGAVILMFLQTLAFSRSGLVTLADNFLIVVLALFPTIRWRRKYVGICLALTPLLLASAFFFYAVSTTTRQVRGDTGSTLAEKVELLQASREILREDPRADFFIGLALARAGYFDYSAEIIAHSDKYSTMFTVGNYFKSIIDNVLSPGFDVFDQPTITASLKYVYSSNLGVLSRKTEQQAGHSDHIGIYAEMYALFGYASFPVLFLLAYSLKKIYRRRWVVDPAKYGLIRVLILLLFYRLMNSFGLDGILLDLIATSISFVVIYRLIFLVIRFEESSAPELHETGLVDAK